jgi:predicted metalloprotease with PDZ domain
MTRVSRALLLAVLALSIAVPALAQAPVTYRLSFAEREHHLMDVEATFADVPGGVLQLRMSRSSPGRYALHQFAKNVFDVRVTDAAGQPLAVARPNTDEWDVAVHPSTVRVTYRVFGDRVDGTYLAIDTTHAHVNMPAAIIWARGLELRTTVVRFEPPPGSGWRVATQLLPGADPLTFTAANLQYLMDSPSEVSAFAIRTFTIEDGGRTPVFRLTVHHEGTDTELAAFARDVERIVREERNVFGEYAPFDGNTYTFIADYLPANAGDGMEHRNSTIVTSSGSIRASRADLLDTIAHEFFHSWNVERIRPKSLEPFDFTDANMSGELWLAEGFTNYYGPLLQRRAGLTTVAEFAADMAGAVDPVTNSPARLVRTAEEMSQYAPFADAATSIDPTNRANVFISYYTWGQAIALGLDLTLRDRSAGRVTLDDFMRAMWERYGKPGGRPMGYVDHPYTIADAKAVLATVAGDSAFADDFFRRYVQGHDVIDYASLLARAGLLVRPAAPGQAYAGDLALVEAAGGVRLASVAPTGSPAYSAGLDRDDVIVSAGGATVRSAADFARAVQARKPGDTLAVTLIRSDQRTQAAITLAENPHLIIVPAEEVGQSPTDAQKQFRAAWLNSPSRNGF